MLDEREWFKQAKALPVGSSRRVYHGAERRPNMVVYNQQDSWSAYCHSCHDSGKVRKEFVKVQEVAPIKRKANDPGFLRSLDCTNDLNIPYSDISLFLHKKGMALQYIQNLNPKWSAQDKRIVLSTAQQVLGRDITDLHHSKWYKYSGDCSYVKARDLPVKGKIVVLTEDLFSACKGQYFAPDDTLFIALVGTRVDSELLVELTAAELVVIVLDGDSAGDEGTTVITRTLRLIGVPHKVVRVPDNKDPKDMPPDWWRSFHS